MERTAVPAHCTANLQVYWVDVDYLDVAWAALSCSACFTALLYCELYCEETYGRLGRPEPSLLDEARLRSRSPLPT